MQLVVRSGPSVGAPATTIRYLLPPDAGPELATMHGMFDTANGVPDPAARARLRDGNLWAGTPPATAFPAKADVFAATKFDAPPAITYLPDPLAVGATIRPLSGGEALGLTADAPALVVPFVAQAAAYPDGFAAATVKLSRQAVPGRRPSPVQCWIWNCRPEKPRHSPCPAASPRNASRILPCTAGAAATSLRLTPKHSPTR